jgi:uncharacterized protein YdaU (DUF1376 family)
MHYYQFHIGDYRAATAHLSNEEDLAYRRLLDMYYDTEKPIPNDTGWLARRVRVSAAVIQNVLDDMFQATPEGYRHARADAEIAKFTDFCEAGKRGAAIRWAKQGDSPPNATAMLTTNHKPITNNHKPNKTKAAVAAPPEAVSESVWLDFVALRKAKKAVLTNTAIIGIQREAKKAGVSLEQALQMCCERGWTGFRADWVAGQAIRVNPRDVAHITTPTPENYDAALKKIDADRKNAVPIPDDVKKQINQILKKA